MKGAWFTVAAWVAGPPAVAALVIVLGDVGSLGWPPAPARWPGWLVAEDPAVAAAAILRLSVVLACALTSFRVCAAIVVGLVLRSGQRNRQRGVEPRSLFLALRRISRPVAVAGLGLGVAASTVMADPAAAADLRSSPSSVASLGVEIPGGDDGHGDVQGARSDPDALSSFAEMRRARIELAAFNDESTRPDTPEVWVVERGDHLWSIAAETLAEHLGETPSERRVARYWHRLIDANLEQLVIPGEPDVIIPGQRLVLPRPASGAQRSGT